MQGTVYYTAGTANVRLEDADGLVAGAFVAIVADRHQLVSCFLLWHSLNEAGVLSHRELRF